MRLSHNMTSLNIYKEYSKVLTSQASSLNKISSGYKVNKAKDNPNALSQSEKLRMQIRGMQMASRNVQDGVSMLQTAEGGLDSVTSALQRIRELAVKAGSGANTASDKVTIQNEIDEMVNSLDSISANTEFNGIKLLQGDKKAISMAVGANPDEKVQINRFNLVSNGDLNLVDSITGKSNIDISSQAGVDKTLQTIDAAIGIVISARSEYGALENRFESSFNFLDEIGDKIQGSDSELRDTDIAEEMAEYSKAGILIEAGNAMMAQANKFPQDILRILDRR
jgi:flagellin